MPLYIYLCKCGRELERIQPMGENNTFCPECGMQMIKMPTFPAMVKMKGEGGYPSRRKHFKGTAPYTTRQSKAWLDSDPHKVEGS